MDEMLAVKCHVYHKMRDSDQVLFRAGGCCTTCVHLFPALLAESNEALREFLLARNPKQQHSATLESYMIKPIQRILKYPLLLQQLCALTHLETDEHHHLTGENLLTFIKRIFHDFKARFVT